MGKPLILINTIMKIADTSEQGIKDLASKIIKNNNENDLMLLLNELNARVLKCPNGYYWDTTTNSCQPGIGPA